MKFSLSNTKERLAELKQDIEEQIEDNITQNLKEFGADKLNEIWDGINDSAEVLLKAGYTITDIVLTLGLPPSININFTNVENVEGTVIKKLMIENKERKILYILLGAILKANELDKAMRTGVYEFAGLTIKVGAKIPQVEMRFKKDWTKSPTKTDEEALIGTDS